MPVVKSGLSAITEFRAEDRDHPENGEGFTLLYRVVGETMQRHARTISEGMRHGKK